MTIECVGCSESIDIQDNNTQNVIVVACPVCNSKNKLLPKAEEIIVKNPIVKETEILPEEVISETVVIKKKTLMQKVKSWLSL